MQFFLLLLAVLAFGIGCLIFIGAGSAMHEQVGAQFLLISAVLFSAAGIIEAVKALQASLLVMRREIEARLPESQGERE